MAERVDQSGVIAREHVLTDCTATLVRRCMSQHESVARAVRVTRADVVRASAGACDHGCEHIRCKRCFPFPRAAIRTERTFQEADQPFDTRAEVAQRAVNPGAARHVVDFQAAFLRECDIYDAKLQYWRRLELSRRSAVKANMPTAMIAATTASVTVVRGFMSRTTE